MTFARSSGILLHPTSFPGPHGIGDLGPSAYDFIDFLAGAKQRLWQILPLGPTGYGDSPYAGFSAFAGNPLLLSLQRLVKQGLLTQADLEEIPPLREGVADYAGAIYYKLPLLRRAFQNAPETRELVAFREANADWLPDFALFLAAKEAHGGVAWHRWDPALRDREPQALAQWREKLRNEIAFHEFTQLLFFEQWLALRSYCHDRGIQIIGDVPIYVAHDSADVWAHPELFQLEPDGSPRVVAGVPPDYFSATGQLWGNPLYRWDVLKQQDYAWWADRIRSTLQLVDRIRLDHFRGFEAYWEVPGHETTAVNGRWVKGPGADLFAALERRLGNLPLIAENLGVITPEVEGIRHRFGFPGMSILQFAFGKDPQAPTFRPHNYPREVVAYTGTHDNDTTVGWWQSAGAGDSTRTEEDVTREHSFTKRYLHTDGQEIHWDFIRTLMASVADTVVIPLQDVLGLGNEARMNMPSTTRGNWLWRAFPGQFRPADRERLAAFALLYDRA